MKRRIDSACNKIVEEINDPINEVSYKYFGIRYVFPFQRLVIANILRSLNVNGFEVDENFQDELSPSQIVLLPTGAGKSLCFMLPAFMIDGITLVVFPLLSLLSDQLRRTEESGLSAVILRGGQDSYERNEIFRKCSSGEVKMILTNPETLKNPQVLDRMSRLPISHVVIDEAHTVSEWGDSFRPAYLELTGILKALNPPVITAFTATASEHILKRIGEILFPESHPNIIYGNPDRTNISYSVEKSYNPSRTLLEIVRESEKPLIVFSSSRTSTELHARMLQREMQNSHIRFYHAGLSREEKDDVEKWFFTSNDGILSATCAYGMGVDKQNIRTVVHTEPPSTVEAYLQESGRGGRDRESARAILIHSPLCRERLEKITNPLAAGRYGQMLDYCENTKDCRRESLLAMLGSTPEICSGCDVCEKTAEKEKPEQILGELIRRNRRRFTRREFIHFLKGYNTRETRSSFHYELMGYSSLREWDSDMIEELVDTMIRSGLIRVGQKLFRKNRLT